MRDHYEKARRILESLANYPGLPEHPRAHVSMRVWRYPSFEPYSSWAIIESEQMFLRRVTWNQRVNPGVGPDTFGSEVPIALFQLEPLLAQLKSIQLPPFIPAAMSGIDGTSYGIELGSYYLSARLSWWETPPAEWAALRRWHAEAVASFEALLPASTPTIDS